MRASVLWRRATLVCVVLTLLVGLSLVPHLLGGTELVRLRNALLLQAEPATTEWTPASVPEGFLLESAPPNDEYAAIISRHALVHSDDDWATALAIGRQMLPAGRRSGGAIQAGLDETWQRITEQGEGYCGDYADSFTGLATAAGVFSRAWAFSFDGFGGHGHIFNEIWDRWQQRWIMLDVFNNFYPADASGRPMSALEFRAALQADETPQIVPVDATANPGFKYTDKLLDYYHRGLPEWYLWWGNNVFAVDAAAGARLFGWAPPAVQQLATVAQGVYPPLRILETPENAAQRATLQSVRTRLLAVLVLGAVSSVCLLGWLFSRRRVRAESHP